MTDCGRVNDWIEGQNVLKRAFRSKVEVQNYVSQYDTQNHSNDNFWSCVDDFDFETEMRLFRHHNKYGTKWVQLHRIDRMTHRFEALDLDAGTSRSIREFLGGLDD